MEYLSQVRAILDRVEQTQGPAINNAATVIADRILVGGVLNVFATGHSHLLAEELYFRAGGLVPVNALLEPGLMLHEGPRKSSALEKLPGLAEIILDHSGLAPGDLLLVISTSGVNAVPVEMALEAKRRGMVVIALTSLEASRPLPTRPDVGKHLYEVADVVLDSHVPPGDAICAIQEAGVKVGPASTVVGAAILNQVVVTVAQILSNKGQIPPVLVSNNLPGGSEHNNRVLAQFANKVNRF